jgi:hypothetical protein
LASVAFLAGADFFRETPATFRVVLTGALFAATFRTAPLAVALRATDFFADIARFATAERAGNLRATVRFDVDVLVALAAALALLTSNAPGSTSAAIKAIPAVRKIHLLFWLTSIRMYTFHFYRQ